MAAVLLAAWVLAACGSDDGSSLPWRAWETGDDDGPVLEVRETLRMGGLEAPDPYLFSTIADVARDDAGRYYVADEVTVTTRVFDADGSFLREIGHEGQGPGELVRVDDILLAPGRVVMVNRRHGGRVTVHTRAGEPVDDWRHTRDRTRLLPLALGENGWLVERIPFLRRPRLREGESWQSHRTLHRLPAPGDSLGPEIVRWVDETWHGNPSLVGPDALEAIFQHPHLLVADGRGRLYRSDGYPYRVAVLDEEGREMRRVGRDVEPVPVDDRDVRALRREVMAVFDTISDVPPAVKFVMRPMLKSLIDQMAETGSPAERTVVGDIVPAADGSIWVERWDYESPARRQAGEIMDIEVDTPNRWDLFDSRGAFVGQATLPPRFRATHATARTLTGVLKGVYDLEFVVTYEVVGVAE